MGEHPCFSQRGSAIIKLPNNKELDLSYQIYPTSQHENILIKIKDRYSLPGLEDFDLDSKARDDLQRALDYPQGMVLATGTAKSGLTTTLYALLKAVNKPHLNVLSIEDPIECVIEGVTQGQIDEESGHTYEQYLRYVFSQLLNSLPGVFPQLTFFNGVYAHQIQKTAGINKTAGNTDLNGINTVFCSKISRSLAGQAGAYHCQFTVYSLNVCH